MRRPPHHPCLPSPSPRPIRSSGFTLIELVIAVTIAGVLISVGAKGLTRYMNQSKVTRAAQSITNDLQSSFLIAARNHRPVRVVWDPTRIAFKVTDRTQTQVYRSIGLGPTSGFSMRATDVSVYPAGNYVEVFPNGLASDSFTVRISRNGYSKRLMMTRAGLVLTR